MTNETQDNVTTLNRLTLFPQESVPDVFKLKLGGNVDVGERSWARGSEVYMVVRARVDAVQQKDKYDTDGYRTSTEHTTTASVEEMVVLPAATGERLVNGEEAEAAA